MVPGSLRSVRGCRSVKSAEAYEKLFANPKVDAWLDELLADPVAWAEELPAYTIDPDTCVGCLLCLKKCPTHAIDGANKVIHVIDQERCTHCGTCFYVCPPCIAAIRRVDVEAVLPSHGKSVLANRSRA